MKVLYENEAIPKELEKHIIDSKTLHQYFDMSFNGIKPNNYCGFLHIDDSEYFIIPKISSKENDNLNIFIYMLMYAYDIKLSHEHLANFSDTKHKFFEIFIRYFSDKLLGEFKKGVFKKYITQSENLKVLRGKYIIDKNFTNFYHQNIFCEYDEFSMDNKLNKFFLYALKVFKKFSNYQNLSRCEMLLDEVKYLHVEHNRVDIYFDRLSQRYQKSFDIALMILNKLIPLPSKSNTKSFAFLFDMSEVFEKFIANIYKTIDDTTKVQYQKNFGNLQLKPDIITKTQIIDTKYKKTNNKDDLITNDKYQMFAYGTNFGIKDTMLLYPKHLLIVKEALKLGVGDKMINLKMRSIDLESEKEFDEYVEEIKKRLEELECQM
jgi:5-methylcytosine-specific restriction enzyme subunit McrC